MVFFVLLFQGVKGERGFSGPMGDKGDEVGSELNLNEVAHPFQIKFSNVVFLIFNHFMFSLHAVIPLSLKSFSSLLIKLTLLVLKNDSG